MKPEHENEPSTVMATTKGNSPDAAFTPLMMREEVGVPLTVQQDKRRIMESNEECATCDILVFDLCENQAVLSWATLYNAVLKKKK